MNSYKNQSYILRRDEPELPVSNVKHYALLDDAGRPPRKRSRVPIIVVLVLAGLLAGWIGGKYLPGAFQRSNVSTDVPVEENAAPASQPQPNSRPSTTGAVSGGKSARPHDQQPESQPAITDSQPPPDTRVDEDKEQEDRKVEVPTREQSSKEIGQSALDKILKENDKIKRGKHLKANKNDE